jgi:surface antigen
MKKFIAIGLVAVSLAACNTAGQKEIGGTLLGGGLGALAGSQVGSGDGKLAATAVGTLLGAFLGREAGTSLDRADRISSAGDYRQADYSRERWSPPASPQPRAPAAANNCERLQSGGFACQAQDGTWSVYK